MPFTENFVEFRFGGPAWNGQESWSCGLKLRQIGGDDPEAMAANIEDVLPQWITATEDYFESGLASFNGGCRLQWLRANVINKATGKYFFPQTPIIHEWDPEPAPPGPVGIPQTAYRVTCRSGLLKRGPGARGGWFVPVATGAAPVTSTGVMPENVALAFADAAGTFLNALADTADPVSTDLFTPWLFGDGIGGPNDSPITTVSVGNVYDTQRRRRDQLEETYIESTTWNGGVE